MKNNIFKRSSSILLALAILLQFIAPFNSPVLANELVEEFKQTDEEVLEDDKLEEETLDNVTMVEEPIITDNPVEYPSGKSVMEDGEDKPSEKEGNLSNQLVSPSFTK